MGERIVAFENPSAGISLAGTLVVPDGPGPCPAAILVHGQGPLDRDMSFGHLKPFRALAEHLAASGIGSLRYDKRGVGKSGGDFGAATRKELAGDVVAALEFLERREEVLPDRIGLIGQSEGGVIAPMVASSCDDVAFAVLLAGPAVPGRENLGLSFALFAQASPTNDLSVAEFKPRVHRLLELLDSGLPEDRQAAVRLAASVAPHVINKRTEVVLGGNEVTAEQFVEFLASPCLQETVDDRPETYLSRLTCPVLALFAERDKHVPAAENMAAAKRALAAAGNRCATVETVLECNHLFQRCATGYPDEYFAIDHDIAPEVLDRVSGWIERILSRE